MKLPRGAIPVALLVLATAACGADDHGRLLEGWEGGPAGSALRVTTGEAHCEWDDALLLSIRWPPGPDAGGNVPHLFTRDPEGVLDDFTVEPFDADTELPDDAVATGHENADADAELWLAADLSTAYVVTGDAVEAWPAASGVVCA